MERALNIDSPGEQSSSCVVCDRPDSADNMVQCDKCNHWWHYSCAGVTDSIANRDWMCMRCLPAPPRSSSNKTSSSRKARLELSLLRLEEEKELRKKQIELDLEKQFVNQKYQLIEESLLEECEDGNRSVRDRIDEIENRERADQVTEWVKQQLHQFPGNVRNSQPLIRAKSMNGIPTYPTVLVSDETGAVGGTGPNLASQNDAPSNQQGMLQSHTKSNAQAVQLLRERLQNYRDKPTADRFQQLREQLGKCQIDNGVVEPTNPTGPAVKQRHAADVSKGAIPKLAAERFTAPNKTASHIATQNPVSSGLTGTGADIHSQMVNHPPTNAKLYNNPTSYAQFSKGLSTTFGVSGNTPLNEQQRHAFAGSYTDPLPADNRPPIVPSSVPGKMSTAAHQERGLLGAELGPINHTSMNEQQQNAFIGSSSARRPQISIPPPIYGHGETSEIYRPTPEQIAARHVMPRNLPEFSGDPESWPLFVSSFHNSTAACGYSYAENLARLQHCLKGDALKAVRYYLLSPESVPEVMKTLQTLFGRPEIIIGKLLRNVRDCPTPKAERLETLIDFGMTVRNLTQHLVAVGQQAHLSNPMLLQELVEKLPANIKLQWAQHLFYFPTPTLQTFSDFMSCVVDSVAKVVSYGGSQGKLERGRQKERGFVHAHIENDDSTALERNKQTERSCLVCGKPGHRVKDCGKFKASSTEDRWKIIHSVKLCRCCLSPHGRRACRSSNRCGINDCQFRHHPLLHSDPSTSNKTLTTPTEENHVYHHCGQSVLFRIIAVTLRGALGAMEVFALLDEGSSTTLIEKGIAEKLGMKGPNVPLCLKWTGDMSRSELDSQVITLEVSMAGRQKRYPMQDVRTVSSLNLPSQTLRFEELQKRFDHLKGLPVQSYENAKPRLLIGLRDVSLTVPRKVKSGSIGPIATKSLLGWTLYGSLTGTGNPEQLNFHVCECESMDAMVRHYIKAEDCGLQSVELLESSSEKRARHILEQTTVRVCERFETGLLWKYDHIEMPESYPMALRRLECLERRLNRDPVLKENVHRQVAEYQQKGYSHRATTEELAAADPRRIWYLPLGVVTNPKKPGKVRLVWDAAAKVDGISLNSVLLPGPDLLTPLPAVLFRFRQYPVAVTSDIREMFHRILIAKPDRHSQRFLWRSSPDQKPSIFLMDVATFGATCSPVSAQFVKNKNASEFAIRFPRAAESILRSHYVDDYLDSFETHEEAMSVSREVALIHTNGGFELHNWSSNSKEVLEYLGEAANVAAKDLTPIKDSGAERVLGMLWRPEKDKLGFATKFRDEIEVLIETKARPTKRLVLKCIMSLFDPLGLLACLLVHGKVLMQDIWRTGIRWDEPVNDQIFNRWEKWIELIGSIKDLDLPRCYFPNASSLAYESLQVHVFVDASEVAYAAAVYFRIVGPDGIVKCSLVAAKTKVAPLKYVTIPRMELMAAALGTSVLSAVIEGHTISAKQRFLWSDSKTVLSWIHSDHRKYRAFVASRVGQILTTTSENEWQWVPSNMNVADEATKWGKGPCFDTECRWFVGPDFLYRPESEWPSSKQPTSPTKEEIRPCFVHRATLLDSWIDVSRFSKWNRFLRAVAYTIRAVSTWRKTKHSGANISRSITKLHVPLSQENLIEAEIQIWKLVQRESYPDEEALLSKNRTIPKGDQAVLLKESDLYTLTPTMDEHGVIRIDGRIGAAKKVPDSIKCPIILPRRHRVTYLLTDHYHREYLHGNNESVFNEMRQRFYVPQLRVLIRKVSKQCLWCKVYKARPDIPRMAPLPAARLSPFIRPFSFVGLDYFGPILVKVGRSNAKRWIALFTCLTIRAVHVEVAYDLSTASCISCITRFIGRRGAPQEIHSDNGKNFVGAERILRDQMKQIESELAATFTTTHTKWVFIPPSAPHMGGSWERMVRSIKSALFGLPQDRKLDDEALQTMLVRAEAIVNSRPLTYLPIDSEEQEALTPNHFLLGSSNGIKQPTVDTTNAKNVRNSWDLIEIHLNHFWRRWIREYLPTLTRRTKWFEEVTPIQPGMLVVIIDESRRNGWIRGRILDVVTGRDGRIRQATVQTAAGVLRRPVSKLAVLDVDECGKAVGDNQLYERGDVTAGPPTLATLPRNMETASGESFE